MEKRDLYEIIGRLYAQVCEMSETEDELRKDLGSMKRTFIGTMKITPVVGEPFTLTGEWVYNGYHGCWYYLDKCTSYPEEICEVVVE